MMSCKAPYDEILCLLAEKGELYQEGYRDSGHRSCRGHTKHSGRSGESPSVAAAIAVVGVNIDG